MSKPTFEPINAAVSFVSNSPGMPTGYGQQTELMIQRMLNHDMKVASLSNYGHEGGISTIEVGGKKIPHYPRGLRSYSEDVIPMWHNHFASQHPKRKSAVFTLYDVWVYEKAKLEMPIIAWTPLDRVSLPPHVGQFLRQPNVTPITMAPHGQRQLEQAGIESRYIPHGIDTKVYRPTDQMSDGQTARQYLGLTDEFLVGMVSANKANGFIHRKAFCENLFAFSMFKRKHPNAKLYMHAEPTNVMGGFSLPVLAKAVGLDPLKDIIFPDPIRHRLGYSDADMAALYTSFDVLLHTNYGEGFGLTALEAQACGTRVITSNWAASADLVSEDSFLVEGQPFWEEAHMSFFQIPIISSIVQSLELAFDADREASTYAINFAREFDVEKIWRWHWLPFFREYFKA